MTSALQPLVPLASVALLLLHAPWALAQAAREAMEATPTQTAAAAMNATSLAPEGSLQIKGVGTVRYERLGEMGPDALNRAVSQPRPVVDGPPRSLYDQFNGLGSGPARPFEASTMGAKNGVVLYRIHYSTTIAENGNTYPVSGLLVVPQLKAARFPLLSWQHGTVIDPLDVPSNVVQQEVVSSRQVLTYGGSAETLFNLVRFAGRGYAVAASDYIANGQYASRGYTQTYAIKGATQQTLLDMLTASEAVLGRLGKSTTGLFLNGWSQGGMNTQWLAEALQARGVQIQKLAPICPPIDTARQIGYWINDYPGDPPWLTAAMPLLIGAYQHYYGLEGMARQAIRPQFFEAAKRIYLQQLDWRSPQLLQQLVAWDREGSPYFGLPTTPKDMLQPAFIAAYDSKRGDFYRHVAKNTALSIHYKAPVRFYGASGDNVVPWRVSVAVALAYQQKLGNTAVSGVDFGPKADHRSAFLAALFGTTQNPGDNVLDWFNQRPTP